MSCCFWWMLVAFLLGWLLNWLLCKWTCNCGKKNQTVDTSENTVAQPVANVAASAPVQAAAPQTAKAAEPVQAKVAEKPAAYVLDSTAAKAAGFKIKGPNDLTVIEGIGPKINQLFNNAGFHTFAEVSQMAVSQMQKILDDAGPRYRLARPDTWAQQAELAANNKWAELKTLQDELDHGV